MDADDEMIVVIVGDGENDEFPASLKAEVLDDEFPALVKTEVLEDEFTASVKTEVLDDDEVEKLIEKAATYGESIDSFVKEELDENYDSTEEWGVGDEDYVPERDDGDDDEDEYNGDDADDGSGSEAHYKQRHKMLRQSQQKSFVKELRDQYPELEDDSNALVTTLSEIMRNVKPPPPPQDYFIMNSIMFECVTCGTLSETQPAAGRHYQEKHGERYLICFACGVDFRSTTNLYKHEKRCMAPDAVVVLKARARVLGRKGRSRPYIPKHFPESDNVRKPSERKYPCSLCPAAFVSKTYLRSHEMLHRGVRPYMCSSCPCAYTSLAALSRHRKKHSDEQYICDHCGRVFKIKAALVTHMDTHLPVKKFGCDQCEKRYATKAALIRHVKSKHLNLPPPCVCKICFKRYPLMSVLKEHTKKAHGLLLMTRRMFFKSLPTLTDTQIEQAKVVLKSELEPDYSYTSQSKDDPTQLSDELPLENSNQLSDQLEEESPPLLEPICKLEPSAQDNDSTEEKIVLSEDVLRYIQSIQGGFDNGQNYNMVVIEDGEVLNLNYAEVSHELLTNEQLVLYNNEYLPQSEM